MTGRKDTNRESFWKKTVKIFKSAFQKKRMEEDFTDSEDYDSSDEESSDYSSEVELEHFDDQKDRIAFTSSQARFVTPENKPTPPAKTSTPIPHFLLNNHQSFLPTKKIAQFPSSKTPL